MFLSPSRRALRPLGCTLLMALAGVPAAHAGDAPADAPSHLVARTRLGFEHVRLPGGEGLGLAGLSELLQVEDSWWLGPAVYGAATGHRGGLFVPGVEGAFTTTLGRRLALDAGLFVGGGGGANAPVGGGLMLRPHVDLVFRAEHLYTGPTYSLVRFPSGRISSRQWGWMVNVDSDFSFRAAEPAPTAAPGRADALGFDDVAATLALVYPASAARSLAGAPLASTIGMVGVRARRGGEHGPWWGIEAAGAGSGGVAGYAQVLGTAGWRWSSDTGRASLDLRGALGLGGGGGIDTGGGALGKVAAGLGLRLSDSLGVEAGAGLVRAPQGSYRGREVTLALDWQLGVPSQPAEFDRGDARAASMEWVAGAERYDAARKDGRRAPLEAVTLAVDRFVGAHLYLTGQAHSAFAGGAGAYSVGLFGLGTQWHVAGPVRIGAEALMGAAGGGGVDTEGGALVQARAYLDVDLARALALRLGAGRVKSVHGGLSAPTLDAALVFRFGVDAPERIGTP